MNRRVCLRSIAASSVVTTAGCLESLSQENDEQRERPHAEGVTLGPPEIDLREASHPSYGEAMPTVEFRDPLADEPISTAQFEGDRTVLLTFFYTSCPDGACPALLLRLRRAQEVTAEQGYCDDAAFLAMTFDPERDTEDVLRTHAGEQGVDLEAGNWHFLRPDRYEEAEESLTEQFGLPLEERDAEEYEHLEYMFPHFNYIFLVNERGRIERVYPDGATVEPSQVVGDFETVVSA
ncbi:SCO1/SenC/PrrC family protein (plasmid) [Natrialba magadii ATCC 43099]|uniref:Electron transport protein SCO1/SenC n=1 Tax=Natrialba magadii (strain ATCC 43099 / DSM 3394 / CCM 3739 / CIP 104546 / IAM 13178 / JCM 8861 / NBRC 102185 / NCIMB 2190 / MS3) TaxID=547559 RepID=D3T0Z3_NATMM|nr:SCO family protein [Natrialba magadii]ADD07252.1 SCO1/SenC/PrrC family protein [Natrialba magadii ATCC 43099]ELY34362.1 electron transport protein SCO1/SenC [Natrialba magadii ATCC 43099]